MDKILKYRYELALFFISYFVLSVNISGLDLYGFDEARNAYCAREMQKMNEWIVPSFNGELRAYKPPLHYYFMILGYKLFGYGGLGARFFSVLAGVACVMAIFRSSARYLSRETALMIGFVLLSSIHFSIQIHQAVPDPYLILFTSLGALLLYEGYLSNSNFKKYLAYAFLGFAVLSKGPVALVLVGFGVFLYLVFLEGFNWANIVRFRPFSGVLFSICIAFPWYFLVNRETAGEFTQGFFLEHNLRRFTTALEGHRGFFLLTWVYVLLGMLPFSVFFPSAFVHQWKNRKINNHFVFYSLCMSASVILFFSISSTKLINYTTPAYPFMAICIGAHLVSLYRSESSKAIIWVLGVLFVLSLAMAVGAFIFIIGEETIAHLQYQTSFLFLLPISCLVALFFAQRREYLQSLVSICSGFILSGYLFFSYFAPKLDQSNPYQVISPHIVEDISILGFGIINPCFISLSDQNILSFTERRDIEQYFEHHSENAYIITQTRFLKELRNLNYQIVAEQKDLFEGQKSVLIKVFNE